MNRSVHTEGQDPQGKSAWRFELLRDRKVVPHIGLGTLKKNALQLRARQSKSVLSVDLESVKHPCGLVNSWMSTQTREAS